MWAGGNISHLVRGLIAGRYEQGSSLVRGPEDVLGAIYAHLGGETYACADAHTLEFSIGGRLFPLDPRDFGSQAYYDTPTICTPNLAPADPPTNGFLYAWSLGDPFLKGFACVFVLYCTFRELTPILPIHSVLAAFYYGNLTYPSRDPPRVGLLSTVIPEANAHLAMIVAEASAAGAMLPGKSLHPYYGVYC
jgi:hypothetical protein